MRATQELEQEIRTCSAPEALAAEDYDLPALPDYLAELLSANGLTVRDAIQRCNLERSYGYQLFNGTRRPTRDTLLVLALTLGLPESDTQRLLKIAVRPPLYARNRRDAAVLYGLAHDLGIDGINDLLHTLGEEMLL